MLQQCVVNVGFVPSHLPQTSHFPIGKYVLLLVASLSLFFMADFFVPTHPSWPSYYRRFASLPQSSKDDPRLRQV
jgi:hypothetical protein